VRRASRIAAVVLLCGCGYPDFGYVVDADGDRDRGDLEPGLPIDVPDGDAPTDAPAPVETSVPDDPEVGSGACDPPRVRCGGVCTDLQTDPNNCGGCGVAPCARGGTCVAGTCRLGRSCQEIHTREPALPSGAYVLEERPPIDVYCEMNEDGGGWTLAMKIDGSKPTFAYDSPLWTDDKAIAPTSTDLSTTEHKNAAFWKLPFKELRLGMIDAGMRRQIIVPHEASSLRALFRGPRVKTNVGRATWMKLLASAQLQPSCNEEGFNFDQGDRMRVRIGIVANEQADCESVDSYIGFGITEDGSCGLPDPEIVVGNFSPAACGGGNDRRTKAFGFVWIR
jgi:hypothetical protein